MSAFREACCDGLVTEGERLFARYLSEERGWVRDLDWHHEPALHGTTKKPDFRLRVVEPNPLVDVKDGSPTAPLRSGLYNPCRAIRGHIKEATKKFKRLDDHPCALALWYPAPRPDYDLSEPGVVFAAMLGDEGVTWPIDASGRGRSESLRPAFLDHGSMRPRRAGRPQNTRIGAVITIQCVRASWIATTIAERLLTTVSDHDPRYQRALMAARWSVRERVLAAGARDEDRICVRVHENPFTAARADRVTFPSTTFSGDYDDVYVAGSHPEGWRRIAVGTERARAEAIGLLVARRACEAAGIDVESALA